MKQILLKKGTIYTSEIAAPKMEPGFILVRAEYSCISAGTEMSGVKNSGSSIAKRILDNPELFRKGMKMVKERGIKDTLAVVKGKYEVGAPLGYSASGVVVESGSGLFQAGDRVACMGVSYANHAGYLVVPQNLAAKIPEGVTFRDASTAALGCIAMQGVRRADVRLGENVVIIGMGILGQLTCGLALSAGASVMVSDLDERKLIIAKKAGASHILDGSSDLVEQVNAITGGHGADSVIITAASSSSDIVSQAFKMCRRRGSVVMVGDAGMHLKREDMYQKELNFLISTSYGPGRYDPDYEERGHDYPYFHVRFTEKRNLESYLRLLRDKRLNLDGLIEAEYPAEEAAQAYEALKAQHNRPLIVLLRYSEENPPQRTIPANKTFSAPSGVIRVALCGAGGFAKGMHLPNLRKLRDKYSLYAVQSRTGANAQDIAVKFGAGYSTTDYNKILADDNVDMVMICSRHDSHADMVIRALKNGKAVFVEKPMCLTGQECAEVMRAAKESGSPFMVGFNRRFSKHAVAMREAIKDRKNPALVAYRMNAGFIPQESWIQGPEGGGRMLGEGCHIFDLFTYLTGSEAISLSADQLSPVTEHVSRTDNMVATVKFADGSVCTLLYTGQGHKGYPKESCEIFCDGSVLVLDDYKELRGLGVSVPANKSTGPEKGHYEELEAFYAAIKNGDGYPIPLWQMEQATLLSIAAQQ
jgi:predicted dehydrogenase/threonine dehydrogenase-like Zn-dependent dehydrogenase